MKVVTTARFEKDFKQARKRGKDLRKLQAVMQALAVGEALPTRLRDHPLTGNDGGRRECHLEPDWLLIYQVDATQDRIVFERTGSHSDLF